jgi:hypothetical protein
MALIANVPSYFMEDQAWSPLLRAIAGCTSSAAIYIVLLILKQDEAALTLYSMFKSYATRKAPFLFKQ